MGRDDGAGEDDAPGRHDGAPAHVGKVEHDGAHADEGIVVHAAAVECGVVSYGDVVAQLYDGLAVEGVEHGAVLYVDGIAEADGVDVAAQDGAVPDAAVASHPDVAHEDGCLGQEASFARLGRDAAQGADDSHSME